MKVFIFISLLFVSLFGKAELSADLDSMIKMYKVEKGDNLFKISKKFNISVSDIVNVNYLMNPNDIKVGDLLVIPKTYKEEGYFSVASKKLSVKQNKKKYERILNFMEKKKKGLKIKYKSKNLLTSFNENQKVYFISEVERMINEKFSSDQDFILDLIFAMIYVESNFNTKVIGDNYHSVGLLQLNKDTVRDMQKKNKKKITDKQLFSYLYDPINNVEFALRVIEYKIDSLNRILKKINKKKYKEFIKRHSRKHSHNLREKYERFFPVISLYNGGIKNYKYVDRVFNQLRLIKEVN